MPASSLVSNPTSTLGSVCRGNLRKTESSVAGLSFAAQPAAFAMEVSFTDALKSHLAVKRFDYSDVLRFVLAPLEHDDGAVRNSQPNREKRSAPADLSTSGGFGRRLCRRTRCANSLGRNFESILVHVKSLFAV